jgi:hypothetical protein
VCAERWIHDRLPKRIISRALQLSFGPCVLIIIIIVVVVREGGQEHLVITVAVGSSTRVTSVHLAQELAGWWHIWIFEPAAHPTLRGSSKHPRRHYPLFAKGLTRCLEVSMCHAHKLPIWFHSSTNVNVFNWNNIYIVIFRAARWDTLIDDSLAF